MKNRTLILVGCMLLLTASVMAFSASARHVTDAQKKKFILVIDAGHGGHDAGAIGKLTQEKRINLNVALCFGMLVERNCPDVKVIYTRKKDVFIPLHTRADIANRNKADLFISIHTNSLPKGRISRGMETYTLGMHRAADNLDVAKRENEVILYESDYKQRYQGFDPRSSESYIMFEFMQDHNMAQSVELAKFVQRRTTSIAARQNKGVKQAGFLVLRETSMPSCLIELGFISTPDEERFLHSSDGVSLMAEGIYMAFLDYKRKHYGTSPVVEKDDSAEKTAKEKKAQEKKEKQEREKKQKEEEEKKQKEEQEKKYKRKSKMAQALADAREGRGDEDKTSAVSTRQQPSADSIVAASPQAPAAAVPPDKEPPAKQEQPTKTEDKSAKGEDNPARDEKPAQQESAAPVFKVQILASGYKLRTNDPQLKGQNTAEYYQEGGLYKYTVGSSTGYREISQLRRTLLKSFPQAFIIAFKEGKKMNVQEAIQEWNKARK